MTEHIAPTQADIDRAHAVIARLRGYSVRLREGHWLIQEFAAHRIAAVRAENVVTGELIGGTRRARDVAIPYLQDDGWHPDEIRCGEADSHWLIQLLTRFERDTLAGSKPHD